MRTLICVLLVAAAACKSKEPPVDPNDELCTHYAKLMVKCDAKNEDKSNPVVLQDTAHNFCLKGMSGQHEQMFGANYRQMIACTRTAETCEALEKCQDPSPP
jgi:hypothetical protein